MRVENIHHQQLARTVSDVADRGLRRLLVTSTGSGEGKTTVVADLGRALAAGARASVVMVDADSFKPSLHHAFELGVENGLGELLDDVYGVDLAREDPAQFGLGDWLELLRAQRLTGDLHVGEGTREFSLRFVRGSVCSVAQNVPAEGQRLGEMLVARGRVTAVQRDQALAVQCETGRALGDVLCMVAALPAEELVPVLHEQVHHRLEELMRLRPGQCEFSELAEPWLAVTCGRAPSLPQAECVDPLFTANVRSILGDPFLGSQLPSYLHDTEIPGLKLLPAGTRACDLMGARHAASFDLLLQRLGRVFDVVLVDVPPASRLTPTAAIAGAVDGVIMVVRAGRFETGDIQRAIRQLRLAGANLLGTVLTDAEPAADAELSPYYRVPAPGRGGIVETCT